MRTQTSYDVGVYCRLSKEDTNASKMESMSISNQKDFLVSYVTEQGWNIKDIYIDDGYTGTNFNRPEFQRMIEDVEDGKINCIVTKDLSRLGRNYTKTGYYTDEYFPERGIRYIALNDSVDSMIVDNDIMPFKHILNEMYAKDISKKIKSAFLVGAKQGKFFGRWAPYGYVKDPQNKNKLMVDEYAAEVVKRIFKMYSEGVGSQIIALTLNEKKISCPSKYHYDKLGKEIAYKKVYPAWSGMVIRTILKNPSYVGRIQNFKRKSVSFKIKKCVKRPDNEVITVDNTHEAIIDLETWEICQKRFQKGRTRITKKGEISLFSGILRCADCNSSLSFQLLSNRYPGKKDYYRCNRYAAFGKNVCTGHIVAQETLIEAILNDIKLNASLAKNDEKFLLEKLSKITDLKGKNKISNYEKELSTSSKRLAEVEHLIQKLFEEKYTSGVSETVFKNLMRKYEAESEELDSKIKDLKNSISKFESDTKHISSWVKDLKQYAHIEKLDRTILTKLIDHIVISEKQKIDGVKRQDIKIVYKFVGELN